MKTRKASKHERWLGTGILIILVVTGFQVWTQQQQFNPAVVAMRPEDPQALESTAVSTNLLEPIPSGLVVMTPMERFTADTLYEKINGQAELYLSSGFVGLTCQRFVSADNPELWLETFVYNMGTERNSFAVYSRQRRDAAQPVEGLPLAYRTPNALFASHGALYIEIISAVSSEEADAAMYAIVTGLTQATPAPGKTIIGLDWFPLEGRNPDSLTILSANAFGFAKLDQVTTVTYSFNGTEVTAFVSPRPSKADALVLADAFRNFLLTYGGRSLESEPALPGAHVIEIMDTFDIIFTVGPYFAGVHEALDRATATDLAKRLQATLKETVDGQ
jgi:hypothetical protein